MWGYTDITLANLNDGVNQLYNIATAVPMLNGTALTPVQAHASVFTVPTPIGLGISKSFGPLAGGPAGTTVLNLEGAVNLDAVPLEHNVVLTDLLPLGMTWANPSSSGTFTLIEGGGAITKHVTATAFEFAQLPRNRTRPHSHGHSGCRFHEHRCMDDQPADELLGDDHAHCPGPLQEHRPDLPLRLGARRDQPWLQQSDAGRRRLEHVHLRIGRPGEPRRRRQQQRGLLPGPRQPQRVGNGSRFRPDQDRAGQSRPGAQGCARHRRRLTGRIGDLRAHMVERRHRHAGPAGDLRHPPLRGRHRCEPRPEHGPAWAASSSRSSPLSWHCRRV